jgi:serine/threonine protein kinase/Tfp pilus assembly protein PilF
MTDPAVTPATSPTPPTPPTLPPTLAASRFVLERELGRGGMATVYLARETKHERQVAIKVLHPEVSAAFGAERFLREIGIAARLSHPHLVPLIDSGEADGYLYYISAFVPGGSLRDRLQRDGKLPLHEAIRIAEEVGAGLDFAHRAGFVHRDVKPENILFADGHALLADFGIARAFGADAAPSPSPGSGQAPSQGSGQALTEPGIAVGTPAYMSPEQAAGETRLDTRSDIYSLACVIYEMLAGAPPFTGKSARQLMAKHIAEKPPRLRILRPETPVPLEEAIQRALEKDPSRRFSTVTEFMAALRSDTVRPRMMAGALRGIVVLPFVNASPDPENEYLSDGITDEVINALSRIRGIRVASRTSAFALKGKSQDVRAIGALLDCAYILEGSVRRSAQQLRVTAQLTSTDDGRLLWSQRYDRQLDDVFAIQDELAETIVSTLRAGKLGDLLVPAAERHTSNIRAYSLYLKGRYEWNRRSQESVLNGIRYFEQAIAEDPSYSLAYSGLADSYSQLLDYRSVPVHEGFELAKKYARKAIELDASLAEPHASLAWSLFIYDWDWDAADREFLRAIDADPQYASAHQWYAFLLASRGAIERSLVEGLTAVELDAGSVSARRSLGWEYFYARRFDQARFHLDRAIAMNPNAEESYRVLGLTLAVDGDLAEAERVLREAVAMPEAGSYTRASLGYALARAGQVAEARWILEGLEKQRAQDYVSPVAFATILLGLGEVDRALDWAETAYQERRGWLAYLKVNPLMDPMRGHARFDALVKKMRL